MNHPIDCCATNALDAWKHIELSSDTLGRLCVVDAHMKTHNDVRPVRLFPLSMPHQWIALFDSAGREIICIEDATELSKSSQSILEQELRRREFVPEIQRIQWVSGNSEPCEWRVETDRGTTSFILKDEKDVRRLGSDGVLILDSHGIRYLITNRYTLDAYSRRIVEWYV